MGNISSSDISKGYSVAKNASVIHTYICSGIGLFIFICLFIGSSYGYSYYKSLYDKENIIIMNEPICEEDYTNKNKIYNCKNIDIKLKNGIEKKNEYIANLKKILKKDDEIEVSIFKDGKIIYNDIFPNIIIGTICLSSIFIIFLVFWIIIVSKYPDIAIIGIIT